MRGRERGREGSREGVRKGGWEAGRSQQLKFTNEISEETHIKGDGIDQKPVLVDSDFLVSEGHYGTFEPPGAMVHQRHG